MGDLGSSVLHYDDLAGDFFFPFSLSFSCNFYNTYSLFIAFSFVSLYDDDLYDFFAFGDGW